MRVHTLLIVIFALAFGVIAAVGVSLFAGKDPNSGASMATIVVAAADVPRGETITAESVVAKKYPKEFVPEGALTNIEDAVGRAAQSPLIKDEVVLDGKLAPKGAGRGLAALIRDGMRAITIPTPNVATGVAGFIVPGSRVDIFWTSPDSARDDEQADGTRPLLEAVEILAVDEKLDAPAANRMDVSQVKSVTVQVKPEDASLLTPALSKGSIHLSLRNPTDKSRAPARPVVEKKPPQTSRRSADRPVAVPTPPLSVAAPVAATPPPAPARTIRAIRGHRVEIVPLDASPLVPATR
jgi:pilus assembly protein CpaB